MSGVCHCWVPVTLRCFPETLILCSIVSYSSMFGHLVHDLPLRRQSGLRQCSLEAGIIETTVFTLGVSTYPAGKLSQLRIDHKTNFSFLCPTSLYWLKTTVPHPEQAMASMVAKSTQRDIIVPQGQPLPLGMTPPRPPSTEARRMKIWASRSLNGISELEHAPNALHSPESGHGTRKKDISSLDAGCWMWIDRMREKSQLMSWDLRWNIFISMDLLIRVGPVTLVRAFR